MAEAGLRERKKERTRQAIFDAAQRLFGERGFDAVTVAEIAREADVSEVTVFNHFPTKEDLFYGGMERFEDQLLEVVRVRRAGETPLAAIRRRLLESAAGLEDPQRIQAILAASRTVSVSPALLARERDIVERYTRRLAGLLGGEDDVEALAVAGALMAAHRAVVDHVRRQVVGGSRGVLLVKDARAQIRRAYGRLEKGLAEDS